MVYLASLLLIVLLLQTNVHGQQNCPKQCFENSPVCGSDGSIYRSKCHLEMKNCGKGITVMNWRYCHVNSTSVCPMICLDIYDPVCGSDGKMYSNKCLMQKQNCGKSITVVDKALCSDQTRQSRYIESCPKTCLLVDKPVCGSDKILYRNECWMRQRNCGRKIYTIDMRECLKQGKACPSTCLTIPDRVCGSDGKWYLNQCFMLKQNCGKSIRKVDKNKCKK